jgi:UDP-4-amino-4-deoxy-L-arabinose formyltransferase/UDP-glucuronic acid dehydrogenase (UDP-4-keto-hexauronic acid decarboxylating)
MAPFDKRIALFGCKGTTRWLADHLLDSARLDQIITISPDLAARNSVADYEDLSEFAAARDVPLYQAETYSLAALEDKRKISDMQLEIGFVMGWQRLIPANVLESISIGCFGMHGSSMNLPLGRGRSPMNWSIIEGREVFYTNLFKYDPGVDSGDIVDTYKFTITDRDDAETMHFKNMLAMRHLIETNLSAIESGEYTLRRQPDIEPTYYPKRTPADSLIDWNSDVYTIDKFIRAVAPPFGGAYTFIGDSRCTILRAQVFDVVEFGYDDARVGTVLEVLGQGQMLIRAFGGLLLVREHSCERKVQKGDIFNNNGMEIKSFPTNKSGKYDLPQE